MQGHLHLIACAWVGFYGGQYSLLKLARLDTQGQVQ